MSTFAALGSLAAVAIVLLAGIGLLRFRTPYARIHAAGKASCLPHAGPAMHSTIAGGLGAKPATRTSCAFSCAAGTHPSAPCSEVR